MIKKHTLTRVAITKAATRSTIRIPKVSFHFFVKLKNEIINKVLTFVSILKLRHKT